MRTSLLCCVLAAIALTSLHAQTLTATPLSTAGSQIVGSDGQAVRIVSAGMWLDNGANDKMQQLAAAGFNTIRLDWSNRSIDRLPDLDRVIEAAGEAHLKVILDDHSNESGAPGTWKPCYAQQANGLWYDQGGGSGNTDGCDTQGTVTDAAFIADWQTVASHFRGNATVIGYDLWNEPLAYSGMSTWEPGSRDPDHNIRWMYERAGNAILAIDPDKLIICEGPLNSRRSFADARTPAPWGDLTLAARYPVKLSNPHKLVYSVHDYPADIGGYSPDAGPVKIAQMNKVWGYLVRDGIAPVWIGEMGANMATQAQRQWAQTLIAYANGQLGVAGGPTFGPGEQGIGIDWWFAGRDPHGNPSGIFDANGQTDLAQQATWLQFEPQPQKATSRE